MNTPQVRPPTRLELLSAPAAGRAELESYVRTCFNRAWGAEVTEFLPWLAGFRDDRGVLLGVLGMRPAETGPLFLEQYLDAPIEQGISAQAGHAVPRESIVEVGNLAAGGPGAARWLITALTACLHAAGRPWVVFTGGPELRNAFHRLGLRPVVLGPAEPARLGEAAGAWGRYYEQRPMVMAGRVAEGYHALHALFSAEWALRALWESAVRLGARGV